MVLGWIPYLVLYLVALFVVIEGRPFGTTLDLKWTLVAMIVICASRLRNAIDAEWLRYNNWADSGNYPSIYYLE